VGEVTVKAGSSAITGWHTAIGGTTVQQAWSATLSAANTLTSVDYNSKLPAGGTATAGFIGSGNGQGVSAVSCGTH
jgi:chitin-binding protein